MKHPAIHQLMVAVLLACLPAFAVSATLSPGDNGVFLTGTTAADQPELAGLVLNDDLQTQYVDVLGGGSIFAIGVSVQNRVVRSSTDGTLIFAPRVSTVFNNTGGNFLVDRVELTGYGSFAVDAAYRTDGLGDRGPTSGSRSADGNILTLDYGFPLIGSNLFQNPQEDSYFPSLNTDASAFTLEGRLSVFARHVSYPGETFRFDFGNIAVPAAVPLPASWLLLVSAFAAIGGMARRRRR